MTIVNRGEVVQLAKPCLAKCEQGCLLTGAHRFEQQFAFQPRKLSSPGIAKCRGFFHRVHVLLQTIRNTMGSSSPPRQFIRKQNLHLACLHLDRTGPIHGIRGPGIFGKTGVICTEVSLAVSWVSCCTGLLSRLLVKQL